MLAMGLAILSGVMIMTSKTINNAASRKLGLLPGSILNFLVGALTALLLTLFFKGSFTSFEALLEVPWYYYLAGLFGLMAMLISNATLHRLPVVHTTSLVISAQMFTALIIDYLFFSEFSLIKSFGALLVVLGVILDQKILQTDAKRNAM